MSTTTIKKMWDEAYCYAKRIEALDNAYAGYGDFFHLRCTSTSVAKATAGTEANDVANGDTVFVIALTPVRAATTINLNATDSVAFSDGDPIGKCKSKVITQTVSNFLTTSALQAGTFSAGDEFLILKNPDVDSGDGLFLYVQSKSETQNLPSERPYYDKGIFKGVVKPARNEPHSLSISQHFQAHDKGLLAFKGHRFNMLIERDDNREGTVTESEYYIACQCLNAGPNESTGDTDSDVQLEIQYLFKGVIAG